MSRGIAPRELWRVAAALLLAAAFAGVVAEHRLVTATAAEVKRRVLADLAGRSVSLPERVERVACLVGPSYEKTFLLGQAGKIALRMPYDQPWAAKTNPHYKEIPTLASVQDPSIEQLLRSKVDVVFYWDYPGPIAKISSVGIPVLAISFGDQNPRSAAAFLDRQKQEVRLYGKVLGADAPARAEEWCAYFDRKVQYVLRRTTALRAEQRPKVYYVRGPDALTTHGLNTNTQWYVEMAGGAYVAKNTSKEGLYQTSMEELVKWNPDVIFMGRLDSTDAVLKDSRWSGIAAVKKARVYVNPNGVMAWDYGSEGVLLLEYFAKTLHPELFRDLDLAAEVKYYYERFYHYKLTDAEASRILRHLPPEG